MKKNLEERVERILTGYHSEVEPGEESMMFDEDMDCLKYCTVGEECREMKHRLKKDNELVEKIQQGNFYAKMALKKAGHVLFLRYGENSTI